MVCRYSFSTLFLSKYGAKMTQKKRRCFISDKNFVPIARINNQKGAGV